MVIELCLVIPHYNDATQMLPPKNSGSVKFDVESKQNDKGLGDEGISRR